MSNMFLKQDNFIKQIFTRSCEISHGRGNRSL